MSCVSVEKHLCVRVSSLLSLFNLRLQAGSRCPPPCSPSLSGRVCKGGGRDRTIFLVSMSLDSKKYNKGISSFSCSACLLVVPCAALHHLTTRWPPEDVQRLTILFSLLSILLQCVCVSGRRRSCDCKAL